MMKYGRYPSCIDGGSIIGMLLCGEVGATGNAFARSYKS